jgi:hypothetical protein
LAEHGIFKVGGVSFPLDTTPDTLLKRADPAIYYALDFLQSVITTYCDDAFTTAATAAGLTALSTAGSVVRTAVGYDPTHDFQMAQQWSRLPLLSLHRTRARYSERTINKTQSKDRWVMDYVLPPLSPGQTEIMHPILSAIEKCVMDRVEMGFDPSYAGGLRVFGDEGGGLASIALAEREYQLLSVRNDNNPTLTTFRMLSMSFDVTELQGPIDASFEPIGSVTATILIDPANGEDPVNLEDLP